MNEIISPGLYKRFPSINSYLRSYKPGPVFIDEEELPRLWRYAKSGAFSYRNSPDSIEHIFGLSDARSSFSSVAFIRKWQAIQKVLGGEPDWTKLWVEAIAYEYWSHRLHWRLQVKIHSDVQCGRRPQAYASMFLEELSVTVGDCLSLGWIERAIDLVHKARWALDNNQFADGGDETHRRTQHFILRLVADWQGLPQRSGPSCAFDEPIFNALIDRWRTPDPAEISNLLLAACDRHTHQSRVDSKKGYFDLTYPEVYYDPFEILAVMKLRQLGSLTNPALDHPLMSTPLGKLYDEVAPYSDELIIGVVERLKHEYPDL